MLCTPPTTTPSAPSRVTIRRPDGDHEITVPGALTTLGFDLGSDRHRPCGPRPRGAHRQSDREGRRYVQPPAYGEAWVAHDGRPRRRGRRRQPARRAVAVDRFRRTPTCGCGRSRVSGCKPGSISRSRSSRRPTGSGVPGGGPLSLVVITGSRDGGRRQASGAGGHRTTSPPRLDASSARQPTGSPSPTTPQPPRSPAR